MFLTCELLITLPPCSLSERQTIGVLLEVCGSSSRTRSEPPAAEVTTAANRLQMQRLRSLAIVLSPLRVAGVRKGSFWGGPVRSLPWIGPCPVAERTGQAPVRLPAVAGLLHAENQPRCVALPRGVGDPRGGGSRCVACADLASKPCAPFLPQDGLQQVTGPARVKTRGTRLHSLPGTPWEGAIDRTSSEHRLASGLLSVRPLGHSQPTSRPSAIKRNMTPKYLFRSVTYRVPRQGL